MKRYENTSLWMQSSYLKVFFVILINLEWYDNFKK